MTKTRDLVKAKLFEGKFTDLEKAVKEFAKDGSSGGEELASSVYGNLITLGNKSVLNAFEKKMKDLI